MSKYPDRHGVNNSFFGRKHSPAANDANRVAHTGRTGSLAGNWKGGWPKCFDCSAELSSRYAKRCAPCYHKHIVGRRTLSAETRSKMSAERMGDKSSNWKGGVSSQNECARKRMEYREWRDAVFKRDRWACQKTGVVGGALHAHHLLNFSEHPELRHDVQNGVTLSKEAHKLFHRMYGSTHNTAAQVAEFIADKCHQSMMENQP